MTMAKLPKLIKKTATSVTQKKTGGKSILTKKDGKKY